MRPASMLLSSSLLPLEKLSYNPHQILELNPRCRANWYRAGADGVFFWNLATPFLQKSGQDLIDTRRKYYRCLTDIGDPKALVGKDKLFSADDPVVRDYAHATSTPILPVNLRADKPQLVPLDVGDDLEAAAKAGTLKELNLKLRFKGPLNPKTLLLRLNGELLANGQLFVVDANEAKYEMTYTLSASPFRVGRNIIEASVNQAPDSAEPVVWQEARLAVRYRPEETL